MSGTAFIFPGQGAQAEGMGLDLHRACPEAREVFREADETLGFSLSKLCFEGPEEELRRTENAQPAILAVSIAAYRAFGAACSLRPDFLAGHSFGEYSALVAAGALSFPAALRLVRRRGELMARALPAGTGTMAAVLGLDPAALREVLAGASSAGVVEPATLNGPGQIVIAGETGAVEEAARLALAAGASRVIPLAVSGPFHSSLMRPAADEFAADLARAEIAPPGVPVVANVTARPHGGPEEIRAALRAQIHSPVRWEESVRYLLGEGVGTFIELGPGKVLAGLVRRISREARIINIGDEPGLKEALAILGEV